MVVGERGGELGADFSSLMSRFSNCTDNTGIAEGFLLLSTINST